MRTNIDIDDKLMDYVMATGEFKTKREAVEAGLKLLKRRKAYDALLAARGTLFWDDSDEAWARSRAELEAEMAAQAGKSAPPASPQSEEVAELAVHEPAVAYVMPSPTAASKSPARAGRKVAQRSDS